MTIESDIDTHHSTKDRSLLDDMSISMSQDLAQLNGSDSGTLILSEEEVEALLEAVHPIKVTKSTNLPPWKFCRHSVMKTHPPIIMGTMRFAIVPYATLQEGILSSFLVW